MNKTPIGTFILGVLLSVGVAIILYYSLVKNKICDGICAPRIPISVGEYSDECMAYIGGCQTGTGECDSEECLKGVKSNLSPSCRSYKQNCLKSGKSLKHCLRDSCYL